MGLRTNTVIEFCVGHDNILTSDLAFKGFISEMLDTLDHVSDFNYTLAANEQNVSVPFGDVAQARIIYLEADGEVRVSLGGSPGTVATLLGAGGTFVGGGTLGVTIDLTPITVVFTAGDTTAALAALRFNAAAALAGLATPRAVVDGGQLRINGVDASLNGKVQITTPLATYGFPITTTVNGTNPTGGSAPMEIQRPADPSGASAAAGITSFFLASVVTTSILLTNPSPTNAVKVKIAILGDLVT